MIPDPNPDPDLNRDSDPVSDLIPDHDSYQTHLRLMRNRPVVHPVVRKKLHRCRKPAMGHDS